MKCSGHVCSIVHVRMLGIQSSRLQGEFGSFVVPIVQICTGIPRTMQRQVNFAL